MKTCVRFHPPYYDPGAVEAFYESMAEKGWLLNDRFGCFSHFRRAEPQKLRYRMEYCTGPLGGSATMPEEQLALYKECGWTQVDANHQSYLFYAPVETSAPELYDDPIQQAETVKGMSRNALLALFLLPAMLLFCLFVNSFSRLPSGSFIWLAFVAVWLLRSILGTLRLHRRLRDGLPLRRDAAAKPWYILWRLTAIVLFVVCSVLCYRSGSYLLATNIVVFAMLLKDG